MKAAAEGKKKEIEKRLGPGAAMAGKLGTASPDSSPSHSGSVHRSQVSSTTLFRNHVPLLLLWIFSSGAGALFSKSG